MGTGKAEPAGRKAGVGESHPSSEKKKRERRKRGRNLQSMLTI